MNGSEITICGDDLLVEVWSGQTLRGIPIVIDLCHVASSSPCSQKRQEVRSIQSHHTHRTLVCLAVSTGTEHFLVRKSDIKNFLLLHKFSVFAFFDIGPQFWILDEFLRSFGEDDHQFLWEMGTQSRLRDPQILDVLVRLASIDQQPNLSEFEHMVEEHLGVSLGPLPTFGDILYPLLDQNHDLKQLFTIDEDDISFLPPSQTSKGRRGRGRGKGHQSPKTMSSQMRKKKLKEALANTGDSSQGLTTNQCRLLQKMSFSFCGNWVEETHLYQLNTESAEQSEKGLDLVVTQLLDNLQSLTAVMTRPVLSFFAYQKMVDRAVTMMEPHSAEMLRGTIDLFGPLSECVQVKAAITLPSLSFYGMRVDQKVAAELQDQMSKQLDQSVEAILSLSHCEDLFHIDARGDIKYSKITGKPSVIQDHLEERLLRAVEDVRRRTGFVIPLPLAPGHASSRPLPSTLSGTDGEDVTSSKEHPPISLSRAKWKEFSVYDPFIAAWVLMEQTAKVLSFVNEIRDSIVHPEYTLLLRNGRTSCSSPNIQQVPRQCGLRSIFVASPGSVFLCCDYSFIELCTLAAVCECRYGHSTLAKVIREGIDPHAYTASMFEGGSLPEFLKLKASRHAEDRAKFARLRQRAKAINFGIPGGQGAASLQIYAKSAYGVELTLQEAKSFREKVIYKVYPELSRYLFEDKKFVQILAYRMGTTPKACWDAFKGLTQDTSLSVAGAVKNVIRGHPYDVEGTPYPPSFVSSVWNCLKALCENPDVLALLRDSMGEGSDELEDKLFGTDVTTMTGRIRGGVGFTQACNTPFSGLAADGAKMAIWDLCCAGYRVIAFVHDEVVLEIPEGCDYTREAEIVDQIMCGAMEGVCGTVPIKCKYSISYSWTREAEPVYDKDKKLIPWEMREEKGDDEGISKLDNVDPTPPPVAQSYGNLVGRNLIDWFENPGK